MVDVFSREGLAIEVGQRLKAEHVVEVPNRLVAERGAPRYLFADKESEFTGHLVDLWAYRCKVQIDFSRPGKPINNAFIECVQRLAAGRMPEPALVRNHGRDQGRHLDLAAGLQ